MVGFGYDLHLLSPTRKLIIGGVEIESDLGTIAHSDGDVALHSLCDALLGAAGLGDIGEHFPDSDPKYKDMESTYFVKNVLELIKSKSFSIVNIDITIILESPKLKPYKEAIRKNIAKMCEIPEERVNIKAKTNEKVDSTGRRESTAAYCVCEVR